MLVKRIAACTHLSSTVSQYTVSQKRCHHTHGRNFVKSQQIFKIQNLYIISHHTLSLTIIVSLSIMMFFMLYVIE